MAAEAAAELLAGVEGAATGPVETAPVAEQAPVAVHPVVPVVAPAPDGDTGKRSVIVTAVGSAPDEVATRKFSKTPT